MTITELLTANPGVVITLVYSQTHGIYSLTANRGAVEFLTTWTREDGDALLGKVEKAMGAVR